MRKIISDSSTEDKGYSRTHRQTEGGKQAYERGEMPLSKWNSKTMFMEEISKFMWKKKEERNKVATKFCNRVLYDKDSLNFKPLFKMSIKELRDNFLEFRGTHYTGNYYRYTKFYGLSEYKVLKYIKDEVIVEPIQLKLPL